MLCVRMCVVCAYVYVCGEYERYNQLKAAHSNLMHPTCVPRWSVMCACVSVHEM